jgi:hypothetical protein
MRLLASLSLLLLAGCSSLSVGTDYDTKADFSAYKTWSFAGGTTNDERISKELLEDRLEKALPPALAARGLTAAEPGDLKVSYYAAVKDKIDIATYPSTYRHWQGETYVTQYEEGTLILDLVDAKDQRLVWRGTARDEVNLLAAPEEREAKLREAITKLLEQYPPQKPR